MMKETWIIGIQITDRANEASAVQAILTKFGCTIRTRLGLHEVKDGFCSTAGIILLELIGSKEEYLKLEKALQEVEGLVVKKMVFQE